MIIRTTHDRKNPYVLMNKRGIEDTRLSFKAKGILSYLLSKPDNWEAEVAHLVTVSTEGETAVRTGIQELIRYGYMARIRCTDEWGRVTRWELHTFEAPELNPHFQSISEPDRDFPDRDFPDVDFPDVDFPDVENHANNKYRSKKNNKQKTNNENKQTNHHEESPSSRKKNRSSVRSVHPVDPDPTLDSEPVLADEQRRTVALLTDEDIGIDDVTAQAFAQNYSFEYVLKQCLLWFSDVQAGKVDSTGALLHRIRENFGGRLTRKHREFPIYRRYAGAKADNRYTPDEYADIIIS